MTAAGRVGSGARARIEARVREILGAGAAAGAAPAGSSHVGPPPDPPLGQHRASPTPSRRSAVALGLVVLIVGVVALGWVLAARPKATPAAAAARDTFGSPSSSGPVSAAPSSVGAAQVVVDVAGRVRRPGVYRLPAGARVDDAVRAAGGALPGVSLESLNLAARLSDCEQVAVGIAPAAAAPAAAGSGAAASGGSALVDLNSASLEQLDGLPGVGPVLAQQILDWRTSHGRFNSIDQLTDVPGIGSAKLATLRPLVSV